MLCVLHPVCLYTTYAFLKYGFAGSKTRKIRSLITYHYYYLRYEPMSLRDISLSWHLSWKTCYYTGKVQHDIKRECNPPPVRSCGMILYVTSTYVVLYTIFRYMFITRMKNIYNDQWWCYGCCNVHVLHVSGKVYQERYWIYASIHLS